MLQAKRTIDEVYQRVQKLFSGQPDLLDEFKYFLPDNQGGHHPTPKRPSAKKKPQAARAPPQQQSRDQRKDRTDGKKPSAVSAAGGGAASAASEKQPKVRTVSYPQGSEKDIQLMDKIKQAVTKPQWIQYVACALAAVCYA